MSTKKRSKGKWLQSARERMDEKGSKGSYGHKTIKQMKKDKAKGGAIGKKANFALNARKFKHGGKKGGRKGSRR
jgi:hypothetical protein